MARILRRATTLRWLLDTESFQFRLPGEFRLVGRISAGSFWVTRSDSLLIVGIYRLEIIRTQLRCDKIAFTCFSGAMLVRNERMIQDEGVATNPCQRRPPLAPSWGRSRLQLVSPSLLQGSRVEVILQRNSSLRANCN